jgi:Protein of unknown function (DUF3435)
MLVLYALFWRSLTYHQTLVRLRPYDLRRMGANMIDQSGLASDEQRRQVMGHDTLSKMFVCAYVY